MSETARENADAHRRSGRSIIGNPRLRAILIQALLLILVAGLGWALYENARANLASRNIASGFGFFDVTAGFGIGQTLIPYAESSTYGRAFVVGLLNTLLVSGIGVVLATVLGFMIGVARLSRNALLARLAGAYVEVVRNLPLLFQILFWYLAVLGTLPGPRQSLSILGEVYINNRGIMLPKPLFGEGSETILWAFIAGCALAIVLRSWASRRRAATGKTVAIGWITLALILAPPALAFFIAGAPVSFERPELAGFNFSGGLRILPEFLALLTALVTYTAAYIAEIVRAGILAVPRGQSEAAYSLGLRRAPTLRLVVLPQAMRVIVPPLTSQYLNLTKNSSLAAAIGYPDFFYVFAGTTLNQTGQAIEIIAITMAVYLLISLLTSAAMNVYNRRLALQER
jgi:general L-amino acid transport system permease protein